MTTSRPVLSLLSALALGASLSLGGCALSTHPEAAWAPAPATAPRAPTADELAAPGPIELEPAVPARWAIDRGGLLDLDRPAARAAGLRDEKVPIVLPVHVLRHPREGVFIVDTGLSSRRASGDDGVGWLVSLFVDEVHPVEPLAAILARQPGPLRGVLFTHLHLDHVLGLPDVPAATPLYVGPGEQAATSAQHVFLRGTMDRLLDGRPPLRVLDASHGVALGPLPSALDLLGDGSLWVLPSPGHTPGSLAFLVRTTRGPVLLTGDTSHTNWGWEHGVEPGSFTRDHDQNLHSLEQLRALAAWVPGTRVLVGHELPPGEGAAAGGQVARGAGVGDSAAR